MDIYIYNGYTMDVQINWTQQNMGIIDITSVLNQQEHGAEKLRQYHMGYIIITYYNHLLTL